MVIIDVDKNGGFEVAICSKSSKKYVFKEEFEVIYDAQFWAEEFLKDTEAEVAGKHAIVISPDAFETAMRFERLLMEDEQDISQ